MVKLLTKPLWYVNYSSTATQRNYYYHPYPVSIWYQNRTNTSGIDFDVL